MVNVNIIELYEGVTGVHIITKDEFLKTNLNKFNCDVDEFVKSLCDVCSEDEYVMIEQDWTSFYGFTIDGLIHTILDIFFEDDELFGIKDYFDVAELYVEMNQLGSNVQIDYEESTIIADGRFISSDKIELWYDKNYDLIVDYVYDKYFTYDYVKKNIEENVL